MSDSEMNRTAQQFSTEIYRIMRQPIAIRSLQCADHATNIPPTVISVTWFLGKRCNYDCSYCSPHTHDAVSPFIDLSSARCFAETLNAHCAKLGKQIKWNFTGGEPFLDPGFLHLAGHIQRLPTTHQMNVTTNGSLPAVIYQQAEEIFDGITFSLHLERNRSEIDRTMDKLQQLRKCLVSVNVMMLPNTLDRTQSIVQRLLEQGTAFIVRKITPPPSLESLLPFESSGSGRKNHRLVTIDQQRSHRTEWKKINDVNRSYALAGFYNQEELDYLKGVNTVTDWTNCGVWYQDGDYRELNSDHLLANNQVSFKGWVCYAGVDNISVDFDGHIYRANCQNGGSIGTIHDQFDFDDQPTECQREWCTCNVDIPIRKALPSFAHHVSGS